MKNTFGNNVSVTLFGESHGEAIGAVLDGMMPGIPVDEERVTRRLAERRCDGLSTARHEPDAFRIVSGVYRGKTTGTPLCILIPNVDADRTEYDNLYGIARPGHADYTGFEKYGGYNDPSGGGHFSGRLTAALVAVGAICETALERAGVLVATRILRCGGITDDGGVPDVAEAKRIKEKPFAVRNDVAGEAMKRRILEAASASDSVGGVLETCVFGIPAGVGEPWFDTVEGMLAHALFSVPGVKGIEFGDGFSLADMRGSLANDPLRYDGGRVISLSNRNGGINGGVTNGMPVVFRLAVKPTPTVGVSQQTVDFIRKENVTFAAKGRHDPAIVHRARPVAEALTAITLCDALAGRFGTFWANGGEKA